MNHDTHDATGNGQAVDEVRSQPVDSGPTLVRWIPKSVNLNQVHVQNAGCLSRRQ